MKISGLIFILLTLPLSLFANELPDLSGRVMQISDGDTFTLRTRNRTYVVSLKNIDAPEIDQPWGLQAKKSLARLIFSRSLRLSNVTINSAKEITATAKYNNHDIAEQMIKEGNAWATNNKNSELSLLQEKAKLAGKGLWSLDHPVNPADWRTGKRIIQPPRPIKGLP